ncbi:GTP cyclohydrolase I [Streptomyces lavendulae]|uniref:GTP cyclohydrolase I n=1 Tax=Streptomyces lavendulae TaxID=1914 RepID=UPI0031F06776
MNRDGLSGLPTAMSRPTAISDHVAGDGELMIELAIPVRCLCAAHHQPYSGHAHIGYLPDNGRIAAPCHMSELVERLCRTPRTQQSLTRKLADTIADFLRPAGAGVLVRAEHSCMNGHGPIVITQTWWGSLSGMAPARRELLRLAHGPWHAMDMNLADGLGEAPGRPGEGRGAG